MCWKSLFISLCNKIPYTIFAVYLHLKGKKFTSKGFLLENLQLNPFSLTNRTRKPNQVSEEVLASIQFPQINILMII